MEGLLLKPHSSRALISSKILLFSQASFSTKSCFIPHTSHTYLTSSHCLLHSTTLKDCKHQLNPLVLWASQDKERDGHTEEDDVHTDIPITWQGAKPLPLFISLGIGLSVLFCLPKPDSLSPRAWQLLAIFLTTITGLILGPLPVGAWAFFALTLSVATGTLPFSAAFSAFTNEVIWLIVISFFFARGFVKTGLGDRIATLFVKMMGGSTLGLSYGLTVSEALIAPAMPSTTARAGGVFLPVIQSLSISAGSKPNDLSSKKLGAFLIQCQFQLAMWSSRRFFELGSFVEY